MTAPFAHRARIAVETLEGRAMMSATLAAPVPEPVELRYELENVLISSYQTSAGLAKVGPGHLILPNTNDAGSHALYQDIFIPANQSGTGTHGTGGGGGAGKVQMRDFSFFAEPGGLPAMTDLAGVPVDDGIDRPVKAGYDFKVNKKV